MPFGQIPENQELIQWRYKEWTTTGFEIEKTCFTLSAQGLGETGHLEKHPPTWVRVIDLAASWDEQFGSADRCEVRRVLEYL